MGPLSSHRSPLTVPTGYARNSTSPAAAGWHWQTFRIGARAVEVDVFGAGSNPFARTPKMARLEAALLVAGNAISTRKLMQHAKLADTKEVRALIDQLNIAYDESRTAFRIERVATGYQLLTRPKFATWLDKLHERQARLKLTPPMMETLSIVAYRQPITRADVEAVRGVQSSEMLKQLMERGLVRIAGEDDSLGRPYLYGTTRQFLESYGLRNLDDLPMAERLRVKPQSKTVVTSDDEHSGDDSDDDSVADAENDGDESATLDEAA